MKLKEIKILINKSKIRVNENNKRAEKSIRELNRIL